MTGSGDLAEVVRRTAELMKNEQGEDMLGAVMEEEDLALMSRPFRSGGELDVGTATTSSLGGGGGGEDDDDDDDYSLLEMMDEIDDEAMYAVMGQDELAASARPKGETFGGLKPGFLGREGLNGGQGTTKKEIGDRGNKEGEERGKEKQENEQSGLAVLGQVRERTPSDAGKASGVSESTGDGACRTTKKPLSKFKLSLQQ